MKLVLSSEDVRTFHRLCGTLVRPLDHARLDDWRAAVLRGAKQLLGADMAGFLLPVDGVPTAFSEDWDPEAARQVPYALPRLPEGFNLWREQARQVVFSRSSLYGRYLEEYFRTEYYNDFVVPNRAFDAIGTTIRLDEDGPESPLIPRAHGGILLHHDSPATPSFGERGLALLRLLEPSVRSGLTMRHRFGRLGTDLGMMLDRTGAAILLCDGRGRVLHQTPRLMQMLAEEPEAAVILAGLREQARAVARMAEVRGGLPADVPPVASYRGGQATYSGKAAWIATGTMPVPVAMITLDCLTPSYPSEEALRARFNLTRQTSRVARLLAAGKSNAEIARTLFIAEATARHHVETVMRKLGVRARAQVPARLMAADSPLPPSEPDR